MYIYLRITGKIDMCGILGMLLYVSMYSEWRTIYYSQFSFALPPPNCLHLWWKRNLTKTDGEIVFPYFMFSWFKWQVEKCGRRGNAFHLCKPTVYTVNCAFQYSPQTMRMAQFNWCWLICSDLSHVFSKLNIHERKADLVSYSHHNVIRLPWSSVCCHFGIPRRSQRSRIQQIFYFLIYILRHRRTNIYGWRRRTVSFGKIHGFI